MGLFDLFSLAAGLLGGFLVGWIIEWVIDRRRRSRDYASYNAEVDELQSAMNRALTARAAMEKERDAALERIGGLTAGNATLDEQLSVKRQEVTNLEAELGTSTTKLRQMAAIEQANERLRAKLTTCEGRIRDLETTCSALENDTKDMGALRKQLRASEDKVSVLGGEKATLREKLASAEAEMAAIGAQMQTASEDMDEVEALRIQQAETQREIERLRANLAAATAQNERGSAINLENNELRARLGSAENELLDTNNRLVASDVQLQNVTDQLTDQRIRADMLEKELMAIEGNGKNLLTAETTALKAELDGSKQQIHQLQTELSASKSDIALINVLRAENDDLRTRLDSEAPAASPVTTPVVNAKASNDRLQTVNGIGNVFARRLNEAGIHTFVDLAGLSTDRIIEIVQAKPWQNIDPDGWVAQADALAQGQVST
ncbi:MAG: hypothetical protein ACPG8W_03875 [Candidatus Promineifilaceae bacterium]